MYDDDYLATPTGRWHEYDRTPQVEALEADVNGLLRARLYDKACGVALRLEALKRGLREMRVIQNFGGR